MQVPIHSLKF